MKSIVKIISCYISLLLAGSTYLYAVGESYEINYGSAGRVKFTKNSRYIAVRPINEIDNQDELLLGAEIASRFTRTAEMDNFRILALREEGNLEQELENIRRLPTVQEGNAVYNTSEEDEASVENALIPTGSLYLKFEDNIDPSIATRILQQYNLEIIEARSDTELIVKTTINSLDPLKIAFELQQDKLIEIAEPEFATLIEKSTYTRPTDKLFDQQWHLNNLGVHRGTKIGLKAGADAHVEQAWIAMASLGMPAYKGLNDVTIALIDDGFDLDHPDLGGINKIVQPWDFVRNTNNPIPDIVAKDWHGTACAGIALGNVGGGDIIGVAPHAKFMPLRTGRYLSDDQIEKWFGYASRHGADVISCSWSPIPRNFPLSTRASQALQKCATSGRKGKGCVVVFSAGNNNRDINDPVRKSLNGFATHSNVIAVAASTSLDERADYSNFGKEISVCAPSGDSGGMGILTTDVRGPHGYNPGNDYYYNFDGTSASAPLVAGVAGLLLSINPDLTATQVKDILKNTARKIGSNYDTTGHSIHFGCGCVNAEDAVKEAARLLQIDIDSTFQLGVKYFHGNTVTKDYITARTLFNKILGKQHNHEGALYHLGLMDYSGLGGTQSFPEAKIKFTKILSFNPMHLEANYHLSLIYLHGQGISVNGAEAAKLLRTVVANNNTHVGALFHLGWLNYHGKEDGTPRFAPALARFTQVLQLDPKNEAANYLLALMHLHGRGTPVNGAEAAKLLRTVVRLSNKTHAGALFHLGWLNYYGKEDGTPKRGMALVRFKEAKALGHPKADKYIRMLAQEGIK